MSVELGQAVIGAPSTRVRAKRFGAFRESLRFWRMRLGLVITLLILGLAILGPLFAPYSPTAFAGMDFAGPSSATPLGTDFNGEDVLSRVLNGGWTVVWMSFAAATIGVGLGALFGLMAANSRQFFDDLLMRVMDAVLALPVIVLALLFVSLLGPHEWLIVLIVGVGWMPQTARVIRGAALEVIDREFVQWVRVVGFPRRQILTRDILPNVITPLMVEFGLRLTFSVAVIALLSFLGKGIQPPGADWGLMIAQNRPGLTIQPWGVLVPVLCIAVLAVGTNLMTEGLARTVARVDRSADQA